MMYYAFICEDTPHSHDKRKSTRTAHLARLEKLQADNRLLTAGPLMNQDDDNPLVAGVYGSLIIAQFSSIEEAKAWIAADPFVTAEVYQRVTVKPFIKINPAEKHAR